MDIFRDKKTTLIISLPKNDISLAKCAWDNGADVVKVHINVAHRASGTEFKSFAEEKEFLEELIATKKGAVGIVVGGDIDSVERDYHDVANYGFDFISLYMHCANADILSDKTMIKMLAADYTYSLDEIKTGCAIGTDIFEMSIIQPEGYGQAMNVRDIIKYKNICDMVDIPIVLPTQRKIKPSEVGILKSIGVSGIMLGAITIGKDIKTMAREITKFRDSIDKLI